MLSLQINYLSNFHSVSHMLNEDFAFFQFSEQILDQQFYKVRPRKYQINKQVIILQIKFTQCFKPFSTGMLTNATPTQRRPSSCQNAQYSSSILPVRASFLGDMIVVKDALEENLLVNNLMWRQKTSMPVVRINNFGCESVGFPKMYRIEVQSMERSIKNLSGVQLNDCLYLIQQCTLGIQALRYKYHNFDFHSLFYGVNERGQCKVWLSHNLSVYKPNQIPLPTEDLMIAHILKMIKNVASTNAKNQLTLFIQQVSKIVRLNFQQFNQRLASFAYNQKTLIPSCIFMEKRSSIFGKANSEISRESSESKQKRMTPATKITFRYESPQSKSAIVSKEADELSAKLSLKNAKPKVTWQYDNLNMKSSGTGISQSTESNYLYKVTCCAPQPKSIEHMLESPSKLKNRLKQSKDAIRSSKISSMRSYYNQKSEQTCTSLTMMNNHDNYLGVCNSLIKGGSQNGVNGGEFSNKTSAISIHVEQPKMNLSDCGYQIHVQEVKHREIQQNVQLPLPNNPPSPKQIRHQWLINSGGYSFGGLLPLPERSVKQSQQIISETSLTQIQEPTIPLNYQHKIREQRILRSLVMSQQDINPANYGWDWANKMSKLLTEDISNLKTSVYCGQQKKPEPLQIKLEMLGKMGRQITSMMPEYTES